MELVGIGTGGRPQEPGQAAGTASSRSLPRSELNVLTDPMPKRLMTQLMGRLLPRLCLLCESPCGAAPLCPACRVFLPGRARDRCRICARPWTVSRRCASCRRSRPAYDATLVAADYSSPLDRAVTALKFSAQVGLASGLGALLADAWVTDGRQPDGSARGFPAPARLDCIVPIPLAAARLRERGFNQAQLIATSMLKRLDFLADRPVLRPALLARQHDTQAQSLLRWDARQANLDHGFAAAGVVEGLHVGVVDDVMTTGATLEAAARALKSAGAVRVVNLVVARTA
jgi:ComF family protein